MGIKDTCYWNFEALFCLYHDLLVNFSLFPAIVVTTKIIVNVMYVHNLTLLTITDEQWAAVPLTKLEIVIILNLLPVP
ncbi:hypothetical protein L1887_17086 [Cichorium endivia]|nr:hypothetical protein L1887_17086 [Cichorium endivia]